MQKLHKAITEIDVFSPPKIYHESKPQDPAFIHPIIRILSTYSIPNNIVLLF